MVTGAVPPCLPALPRRPNRPRAFVRIWPELSRRLEARPNLSAAELLDQLCAEYPGRYLPNQIDALYPLVRAWRTQAAARGTIIGPRKNRTSGRPRAYRSWPDAFAAHWPEMCQHLDTDPDQTGLELFTELQSRYPGQYLPGQLRTLQRRLQIWRKQAARRLVFGVQDLAFTIAAAPA